MMKICLYGVSLWAPITTVFGQDLVTNVTAQLWSTQLQNLISIEAEYPSFLWPVPMENLVEDELADKPEAMFDNFIVQGCAFHRVNPAQNTLWACDVKPLYEGYHQEYPKIFPDPFAFIMAFDEDGHPGKNWLINRSPYPDIAWDKAGVYWDKVLAFGFQNTILTYRLWQKKQSDDKMVAWAERRYDTLVALAGPDTGENGQVIAKSLWQYALPSSVPQTNPNSLTQAEGVPDGGYVLLLENYRREEGSRQHESYLIVRVLAEGQTLWQKDLEISKSVHDTFDGLGKKFFILPNQTIVIYNDAVSNGKEGSQLICLDQNGQETANQFFSDIYWDYGVIEFKPILGDKGFIFPYYDKMTSTSGGNVSSEYRELEDGSEERTDFVDVQFFDINCQPGVSERLMIPTHNLGEKLKGDQIQALQETKNGHLLVVYVQQEDSPDGMTAPSLYLAEFDAKGILMRDIPLIAGENQDRHYLENESDYFDDGLNVQIAFLPKTKELLISVENLTLQQEYQIMLEEKEAVQRGNRYYYPRMYKVKLD